MIIIIIITIVVIFIIIMMILKMDMTINNQKPIIYSTMLLKIIYSIILYSKIIIQQYKEGTNLII